jgi:hypothetical protein
LTYQANKLMKRVKMSNTVTDSYGNEITIQSIAEMQVKSNAFFASKTMHTKRGGNPYMMRADRHARLFAAANDTTTQDVNNQVRAFIAQNPMRFYVTSERLVYVGA